MLVPICLVCIGCHHSHGPIKSAADLAFLKVATKVEDSPRNPRFADVTDKIFNKSYEFPFNETELQRRVDDEVLKVTGWTREGSSYSGPDNPIIALFKGRQSGMTEKFGIPVPIWSDKEQYSTAMIVLATKP